MKSINIPAQDGTTIMALSSGFDDTSVKAAVIICHGYGEHAGCYTQTAERLRGAGYASIIHNQRGHGLPAPAGEKRFGKSAPYQAFIDDVISLTGYIHETLPPGTPVALYGHSMGGNIIINTLLQLSHQQASSYACAVLESPWLELFKPPNTFMSALFHVLSHVTPNLIMAQKIRPGCAAGDSGLPDYYNIDNMLYGFLPLHITVDIADSYERILSNAARIPVPVFTAIASDDTVVCSDAAKRFADSAGGIVSSKVYQSVHSIHDNDEKETFYSDIIAFIDNNVKGV